MTPQSRRVFVTKMMAGIAGSALLSNPDGGRRMARAEAFAAPDGGLTEDYWRLVQSGFQLEPGLVYLNNASLGPSPELVDDATEAFRRRLDAFPSRSMWGGWSDEMEAVRSKCAALLRADDEPRTQRRPRLPCGLQFRGSGGPAGRGAGRTGRIGGVTA